MSFIEITRIIYNYMVLFVKKQYRIAFSKKLAYISDEFPYFSKNVCVLLSKLFSILEIMFNIILPITVIFYPINLKYVTGTILFIIYLTKMKELKIRSLRTYFHKLFIKDAAFEFYGVIIICFNLIIILDIKFIIVFLLILALSCIRVDYVSNLYLYVYVGIYLLITSIILKGYLKFFIVIALFIAINSMFYLYRKK